MLWLIFLIDFYFLFHATLLLCINLSFLYWAKLQTWKNGKCSYWFLLFLISNVKFDVTYHELHTLLYKNIFKLNFKQWHRLGFRCSISAIVSLLCCFVMPSYVCQNFLTCLLILMWCFSWCLKSIVRGVSIEPSFHSCNI